MKKIVLVFRILISALFLLSVIAKLYPTPIYGITKVFEEGQLIPMGFSESIVPYLSRFIICFELLIAFLILQRNYLKKIVIPFSVLLLVVFSTHLLYQIFLGSSDNCGCFGDLIPMTPLQALVKNILTILVLIFIYKNIPEDKNNNFSKLIIQFLALLLLIFIFIPVSYTSERNTSFVSYVSNDQFKDSEDQKILCFFDAGCDHCQEAVNQLDSINSTVADFPDMHIVFSDTEEDKIPDFISDLVLNFSYQIMPFANYDTDEIDSYMEITFPHYDNPIVIFYDGVKQVRLFEGTGRNEFDADEFVRILE